MKNIFQNRRLQYGSYATVVTVVVVALVVLANYLFSAMDDMLDLRADVTRNRVFSLSAATREVVENSEPVRIYTFYQAGNENTVVTNTLKKYQALSGDIEVTNIDPLRDPTRALAFHTEAYGPVERHWLVVASREDPTRFRVIQDTDLYDIDAQTGLLRNLYIEQKVTGAIAYINQAETPRVYFLQGHGEPAVADVEKLVRQLEIANYQVAGLNLGEDSVTLEERDVVIVLQPITDLSELEYESLRAFMLNGGKTMFVMPPVRMSQTGAGIEEIGVLANFEALLGAYNTDVRLSHSVVMESNALYTISNKNYYTKPKMVSCDITNRVRAYNDVYVPFSQGLAYSQVPVMGVSVQPLLETSSTSFAIAPGGSESQMSAATPGEDTTAGPFCLGLTVTYAPENKPEGRMAVFGSYELFGRGLPTGGSLPLFLTSVSWLNQSGDIVLVREKSYTNAPLQLPNTQTMWWLAGLLCIGLPLAVLSLGVVVFLRRRHL